jgi:hypothetical protein
MNPQTDIGQRIERIREIFQQAHAFSTGQEDLSLLVMQLENTEMAYRSIAYEAASMVMALRDFSNGNGLTRWRSFLEGPAAPHAAQAHAGLGWAMAQQRIPLTPTLETLEPLMRFRMLDGWGYYNGIFRQRQTIGSQPFPSDFETRFAPGFDQGVGRSLWYNCKGDWAGIPESIAQFSVSRHSDLWRGIGIAASYVGGCNEFILRELFSLSHPYQTQLSVGAALVARTRNTANTDTPDIELACQVWCRRPARTASGITVNAEPSLAADPNDAYLIWISNIGEKLSLN